MDISRLARGRLPDARRAHALAERQFVLGIWAFFRHSGFVIRASSFAIPASFLDLLLHRRLVNLDGVERLEDVVKCLWAVFTLLGQHSEDQLAELVGYVLVEGLGMR